MHVKVHKIMWHVKTFNSYRLVSFYLQLSLKFWLKSFTRAHACLHYVITKRQIFTFDKILIILFLRTLFEPSTVCLNEVLKILIFRIDIISLEQK